MNTKTLKDTAVSLLIGMVGASHVLAVDTGPESLPVAATAVDVFQLSCPANTSYAKARVSDLNPANAPPQMFVTVIGPSNTNFAESPRDPTEGGGTSGWTARVVDGAGIYDVIFEKTASGAENYNGTANCYNVSNVILPATLSP